MIRRSRILLFTVALLPGTASFAADIGHGEKLLEANCKSCHVAMTGGDGSLLYTRPNRRVDSLAKLESQVRRCESNLELKWFEEDVEDVVQFLNKNYYKFATNP
jgi:cytochrome c2